MFKYENRIWIQKDMITENILTKSITVYLKKMLELSTIAKWLLLYSICKFQQLPITFLPSVVLSLASKYLTNQHNKQVTENLKTYLVLILLPNADKISVFIKQFNVNWFFNNPHYKQVVSNQELPYRFYS